MLPAFQHIFYNFFFKKMQTAISFLPTKWNISKCCIKLCETTLLLLTSPSRIPSVLPVPPPGPPCAQRGGRSGQRTCPSPGARGESWRETYFFLIRKYNYFPIFLTYKFKFVRAENCNWSILQGQPRSRFSLGRAKANKQKKRDGSRPSPDTSSWPN